MQADLIIVGAGMVGSALALALEHSGLEILVVDGSPLSVRPFDGEGTLVATVHKTLYVRLKPRARQAA